MGPTATGKTDLALALAKHLDVALISVDSAMVYRGMDVGTAKPTKTIRDEIPHALIDVREPEESFSVQEFCALADQAVHQAFERRRLPILVGGSMMYFRAFREGLADLPGADARIRADIRALAEAEGVFAVFEELKRIDYESAMRISPSNLKRMERAIEVYRLTGKTIGALWKEKATPPAPMRLDCELMEFVVPEPPRPELHERIAQRLQGMFNAGFMEEMQTLRKRPGLTRNHLSMRTVGYREAWAHLDEADDQSDTAPLRERILVATRQLARKQLTWLRKWSSLRLNEAASVEVMIDSLKR